MRSEEKKGPIHSQEQRGDHGGGHQENDGCCGKTTKKLSNPLNQSEIKACNKRESRGNRHLNRSFSRKKWRRRFKEEDSQEGAEQPRLPSAMGWRKTGRRRARRPSTSRTQTLIET